MALADHVGEATVVVPLRERDLDHQAHVYHGVMVTLLDEGRVRFYTEHLELSAAAAYVVVRVELDYVAETFLDDGPLQIQFAVERAGNTSIRTRETVRTVAGRRVADARVTCVLWDRDGHAARPLTHEERARAQRFTVLGGATEVVGSTTAAARGDR